MPSWVVDASVYGVNMNIEQISTLLESNSDLSLNEYQNLAMRTSGRYDNDSEMMKCAALGLSGESGEFNDLIKKQFYHYKPVTREQRMKEAGDALWYLALYCKAEGCTLSEIAKMNIAKLMKRYPEGFSYQAANAPRLNE